MKISNKIEELQEKIKLLFFEEDEPDYIMIAFDSIINSSRKDKWTATIVYENIGDGHPQYIDYGLEIGQYVLQGFGKNISDALKDLETKINRMLEDINK